MHLASLTLVLFFADLGLTHNWVNTIFQNATPQSAAASSSIRPVVNNSSPKAAATIEIQVGNLSGSGVIDFTVATSELQEPNGFTSVSIPIASHGPRPTVVPPPLYTTIPSLVTPIASPTIKFNTTYNSTAGPTRSFLPPQSTKQYNFPSLGTVPGIPDILVLLFPVILAILPTFF